ncbi:P-loop containing nucleoside triphosphate hydrolase protein [Lentinus tigrinus ALCF2SS1-7]|uniref:P-loop containing nucleoside triphosphate hydrolase protein n=1 Tax=Lentinus tigrinus ALCF2SS1-6 TaxID=1328759 RepID=A0A5C2S7G2_9APHY|nr:P-loop containing nucleoside triphosphate hydrolase protein [Lentinus tigrinus ALCF2SS1-6]RPD73301.1 P-loop containing nucleoside triphosphate hydrolase protein [Lentinus tigrinus ALCF2SS1-7]
MDAAQVLQAVLSAVQSGTPIANTTPAIPLGNAPSSSRSTGHTGDVLPSSLPEMIFMLLSMAAIRDWVKLFLIGAVLEGSRRILAKSWEKLTDYVWVTATFESNDDAAEWLMYWMSQKKVFQSARNIEVSTHFFGLENLGTDDLGENDDDDMAVAFMPSLKRTYSTWYKGRYMTVTRERSNESPYKFQAVEYIEIRMLSRSPRLLRELLVEARKAYRAASDHLISVYVAPSATDWKLVAMQDKRPTSSVILDPGVLELIINDAKDFMGSKKWYADRGIPFRRGYLLYGVPGAGKTSLIHSIAGELELSIYILSLTATGLDDNTLRSLISARLPKTCIVLIEDIDAAFTRGVKRDIADPEAQAREHQPGLEGGKKDGKDAAFASGVTLSGLLNALDGIASQEGRLLFATTNDYGALDPALLRPGRLDLHIEFHLASKYQATELFKRFYTSSSEEGVAGEDSVDEKTETAADHDSSSGCPGSVKSEATSATSASIPENVSSAYIDLATMKQTTQLSHEEATALAERFGEVIPARMFSMATLQGYLMAYKTRPYVAIEDAPAWVEKKLREKKDVPVARVHEVAPAS